MATICHNYTTVLSFYNTRHYKVDVIDRIKFLSIVIITILGMDLKQRDQIAMKMNRHLQNRDASDGGNCDSFSMETNAFTFLKEYKPLVSNKDVVYFSFFFKKKVTRAAFFWPIVTSP